ncbi:MAG: 6-carboxytetrahydropterin synthase QueD [Candidatus Goldbacteria bacterium]|nr:6-carboxytetrahydropterin synthase QueD [Candidatus Goldiibacteriota bacterium]
MYELKIRDSFSAAHNLRNYKGKCEHIHGHNYLVTVTFASKKTNKDGLVIDFSILKNILKKVIDKIDHKYLNEDINFFKKNNPSAENIARYIFLELKKVVKNPKLKSVCIHETEDSMVIYSEK